MSKAMCIQNMMGHDKDDMKTVNSELCKGWSYSLWTMEAPCFFFASFGPFSDDRERLSLAGPCAGWADVGLYRVELSVYFVSSRSFVLCCSRVWSISCPPFLQTLAPRGQDTVLYLPAVWHSRVSPLSPLPASPNIQISGIYSFSFLSSTYSWF